MMNRAFLSAAVVALAVAYAPSANAATFVPGSPNFTVSGNIFSGPISANIGNSGIAAGTFQDIFQFTIPQPLGGFGSGSLSTSTSIPFDATDTDISSVLVNGLAATKTVSADGLSEFFNISNVPISFGVLNRIVVNGLSRGNGSYGGNATFIPIPEPAAWAMMIAGFGLVGAALRTRRSSTRVSFA